MSGVEVDRLRFAVGSLSARVAKAASTIREAEFTCYSQNGEDGMIQWLIARVPIADPTFVEFGVGDYRESNTRFLLEHDNWRGLILDQGDAHAQMIARSDLSWKFAIRARTAFITRENINELLSDVDDDLGLLSIDIDGNDYWVLDAITAVHPRIVIVEYNSVLGYSRPVAVPYDPTFDRSVAHYTWIYSGASIAAFCHWADRAGYRFIGSNSSGNNAFLVRNDVVGNIPAMSAESGWVKSRFGRPRDRTGALTDIDSHAERRALMADMPLTDCATGATIHVRDIHA
jgi:hypothetical protein